MRHVKSFHKLLSSCYKIKGVHPRTLTTATSSTPEYETLAVTQPRDYVWQVELNRPDKLNSLTTKLFSEMKACFDRLSTESSCRCIVLSAAGRLFNAGIDISTLMEMSQKCESDDVGRKAFMLRTVIRELQDSFTAMEKCPKPVIAAIHNACIGAGIDMISAADIRYCSQDAWFQIKEVDVGLAADLGTLQRFPRAVGSESLARELIYTARKFGSEEAKSVGFVSQVFEDKEALIAGALDTASVIAEKSPIALQGSKMCLVYARDHSVSEGLEQMITWNQSMLQSEDTVKAAMAFIDKSKPSFSDL